MPSEASVTPPLPFCDPAAMCPHTPGKGNPTNMHWEYAPAASGRQLVGHCALCNRKVEHTRNSEGQLTGIWVLYE